MAAAGNDNQLALVSRWYENGAENCYAELFASGDDAALIIASRANRSALKPWSAPPPHFGGAQVRGTSETQVFGAFLGPPTRLVFEAHGEDETPIDYREVKEGSHGDTVVLNVPALGSDFEDRVYLRVSPAWRDESNRLYKLAGLTVGAVIGNPWFSQVWGISDDSTVNCAVLIWFGH